MLRLICLEMLITTGGNIVIFTICQRKMPTYSLLVGRCATGFVVAKNGHETGNADCYRSPPACGYATAPASRDRDQLMASEHIRESTEH